MISIIISSSNPEYLSAVKKNIDETIGVPYEVLAVDNAEGKKGICEVYNTAGANAKYDVMCFMHEDVILHTQDWGKKVVEIMSDLQVGLIGVAGSTYKSLTPGGWACLGIDVSRLKDNILQRYKFSEQETKHCFHNSNNEKLSHVAAVDGVWICTRKDIFDEFKFDEDRFKRFHGYDVDFSLQVGAKYKVCVTFEVLLEHFSEGNYAQEWILEIFLLHDKYKNFLPLAVEYIPKNELTRGEKAASKSLIRQLSAYKYSKLDKMKILWRFNLFKTLGIELFIFFHINILFNRY
jgi:hypothetical protein